MESRTICTICCNTTPRPSTPPGDREELIWRKFSRQLLLQQGTWTGGGVGGGEGGKETANNKAWRVCQDCFPLIDRAVEIRTRCEEMEDRVNQLQLEIVKEMKRLGEGMTQWNVEMKGVEGVVRGSEKTYGELVKKKKTHTLTQEGEASSMEFLRRRILEAVKQLQAYQRDLGVKLLSSQNEAVKPEMGKLAMFEAEVIPDGGQDDKNPLESSDNDTGQDQEESGDEEWNGGVNDDPYFSNDGSGSATSGMHDEEGAAQKYPVPVGSERSSKYKLRRSCRKIKATSSTDSLIIDMEEEGDESSGEGLDSAGSRLPILKEYFTLKARQEQKNKTKPKDDPIPTGESSTSSFLNTAYSLEYDSSTGKINFGGIELIFEEDVRVIRCGASECPFQVRWSDSQALKMNQQQRLAKMDREVKNHILGSHLDGFRCPNCVPEIKTFKTKKAFWKHISRMHRPAECDVCGKTIKSKDGMANHKWTHMSEEERAEALRKGQKDPRRNQMDFKDKQANLLLSCSICPKQFRTRINLNKHEQRHSAQRDTVICPDCGKSLLSKRYEKEHKLYHCSGRSDPGGNKKIKCLHCPSMLTSPQNLKRHLKRYHSAEGVERSHLCSKCGKGFRYGAGLQTHMKTHEEERLWKCGWGCGKDFNVRRNWTRHEASCKMARDGGPSGLGSTSTEESQGGRRRLSPVHM